MRKYMGKHLVQCAMLTHVCSFRSPSKFSALTHLALLQALIRVLSWFLPLCFGRSFL